MNTEDIIKCAWGILAWAETLDAVRTDSDLMALCGLRHDPSPTLEALGLAEARAFDGASYRGQSPTAKNLAAGIIQRALGSWRHASSGDPDEAMFGIYGAHNAGAAALSEQRGIWYDANAAEGKVVRDEVRKAMVALCPALGEGIATY
jgi:hypothetical protein